MNILGYFGFVWGGGEVGDLKLLVILMVVFSEFAFSDFLSLLLK